MKMINRTVIVIIFSLGIISCGKTDTINDFTHENQNKEENHNLEITSDETENFITDTPIISSTQTPYFEYSNMNCENNESLAIQSELPDEKLLIFRNDSQQVLIWNTKTDMYKDIGTVLSIRGVIMKDGKVALLDNVLHKLIITDMDGNILIQQDVSDDWVDIILWINEEEFLIGDMRVDDSKSRIFPNSTIYFNLHNSDSKIMEFNFPDIINDEYGGLPELGRFSHSYTVFSNDLSMVVYPTITSPQSLILWDIDKNKLLRKIFFSNPWNPPIWSKNGEYFIISIPPIYYDFDKNQYTNIDVLNKFVGGDDLFLVNEDGTMERLTYLTENYTVAEKNYSISPDQKYIATKLNINKDQLWTLAKYDFESRELYNLCIDAGENGNFPIYWALDRDQFITTVVLPDSSRQAVIVDVEKNKTYYQSIPNSDSIVGWLQ